MECPICKNVTKKEDIEKFISNIANSAMTKLMNKLSKIKRACADCKTTENIETYIDIPGDPQDKDIELCNNCANKRGLR